MSMFDLDARGRQPFGPLRAYDSRGLRHFDAEHAAIEIHERVERHVLRRSGNVAHNRKMRKIGADFLAAELRRMPPPVELDELAHPVQIGPLGIEAEMALAHMFTRFSEKLGDRMRLCSGSLVSQISILPRSA